MGCRDSDDSSSDLSSEIVALGNIRARLETDARALWAVRVLDRWADRWECATPEPVLQADGTFVVTYLRDNNSIVEECEGVDLTRMAARIAAAEALVYQCPELGIDP